MSEPFQKSEEKLQMPLPPRLGNMWLTEIVPQLPATLETQARVHKALQRIRASDRARDVLRGLVAWVLGRCSFRQLGCGAVILVVADISDAAWRKRVRVCGDRVHWVRSARLIPAGRREREEGHPRVVLVDGTSLGETGGVGYDGRVPLASDLGAGRLVPVLVGDRWHAETLGGLPGQPGDLCVGDRNDGTRDTLGGVDDRQAATLVRVSAQHCRLEHADETTVCGHGLAARAGKRRGDLRNQTRCLPGYQGCADACAGPTKPPSESANASGRNWSGYVPFSLGQPSRLLGGHESGQPPQCRHMAQFLSRSLDVGVTFFFKGNAQRACGSVSGYMMREKSREQKCERGKEE